MIGHGRLNGWWHLAVLLLALGCPPKHVPMDVFEVESQIRKGEGSSITDPQAALVHYDAAIYEGERALVENPDAPNRLEMQTAIDHARIARAEIFLVLAERSRGEDDIATRQYLVCAANALEPLQDLSEPSVAAALEKLAALQAPPEHVEPAIVVAAIETVPEDQALEEEPAPSLPVMPVEPSPVAVAAVALAPPTRAPSLPTPARSPTSSTAPNSSGSATAAPASTAGSSKPTTTVTPAPPARPAPAGAIRLRPGNGTQRKGTLGEGGSTTFTVVAEGDSQLCLGDLEVLVPVGYMVQGDGLSFTSTKTVKEHGDTIFLRFSRLGVAPGTTISITVTRKQGPEEYLAAIYLYPR